MQHEFDVVTIVGPDDNDILTDQVKFPYPNCFRTSSNGLTILLLISIINLCMIGSVCTIQKTILPWILNSWSGQLL